MKTHTKTLLAARTLIATAAVAALAFAGTSSAALVSPTTTHAHNVQGAGGISALFNDNAGKITKPDANDPNTWTAAAVHWSDDWQGNGPLSGATNSKVGWVTFDFGAVQPLDEIFIWNVGEVTGQPRRVNTYNIYYSNSPTVAPVSGNGTSVDYNFASGGWTQLGATRSLLQWASGTGADGIETLGVNAQYIGLEFITHGGATDRVGLNEVVFTVIPEPGSLALLGLGGLLIGARRRRD